MTKCSLKNAPEEVRKEIKGFVSELTTPPSSTPVRVCESGIVSDYLLQQGFDVNDLVFVEDWDV